LGGRPQAAPPPRIVLQPPVAPPAGSETAPGGEILPPPPSGPAKVALLLPLSGPSGALGKAMLAAAQLALFDTQSDIELLPRDTQAGPQAAAAAAADAIGQGARLIVGPLLAGEVEAVKPIAASAHVPMVAFSTATQLAGGGTYLLGFSVRQEVERVVAFAKSKGINRFAVLAPATPYGDLAVQAMHDAAAATGAELVKVVTYDQGVTDFGPSIKRAAGGGYDAILIAEGGGKLRLMAPLLPVDGIDPTKVKFLGTGLWDDPALGVQPELAGAWYAAPAPDSRAAFERRYQDLYHQPPPRLTTLAYDGVTLAALLGRNGDFSSAALTNPNGFAGIDGIFRLRPDGTAQRGLAVLEIHPGGPTVVDPAPADFQSLGQ
jgi:ABC-type branched-subunit amino acid transport system substrate-binding protein